MLGINGKPWIDLDPYLDTQSLFDNYDQFCYSIGKNHHRIMPATHGSKCLYDEKYLDLGGLLFNSKNHTEDFKTLTADFPSSKSLRLFCIYNFEVNPMNYNLILRGNKDNSNYSMKHSDEFTAYYKPAEDFKFFWIWLNRQKIFSDIGRVVFFLSEAKDAVHTDLSNHIHRDYADGISKRDEFIWINFSPAKRFYIYDADTKEKHHITSKISTFDNADWHGVEEPEHACFSLRVDGVFSDEFLKNSGMWDHFRS